MRAGYLGPEGTYSHEAAKAIAAGDVLTEYRSFTALFGAASEGREDRIVVPVENAIQGSVSQVLDLLYENADLYIASELSIPVEHCLIGAAGTDLGAIRRVYSHEQALGQCRKFLSERLPDAELAAVESTAEGLRRLSSASDACIAGAHAPLPKGAAILVRSVADRPGNRTAFLEIRRGKCPLARSRRVFFVCGCKNEPGALLGLLNILAARGLNMTKIESRPLKTRLGEYVFFIEFEGNAEDENIRAALREAERGTQNFRLLGCY